MHPAPGTAARDTFRPDIEGLRGVAVLLVVLFHAGLVGLPGGFIGVDVFFVISGFLITGLLLRERERSGSIRLPAFYARRVRRLLPAGMVALAVTLVGSIALLNPLDRPGAALDGAAAALSIGNIRFALAAGDYFSSVASPSPFLHFWSLAVEEQFYLVWPALILLSTWGRRPRLGAGLALGLVAAASFGANLVVTDLAPGWAFYSLPTRAWQLAVGGLLVLAGSRASVILPVAGWLGLASIAFGAMTLDASVAYPGPWALIPTIGAAALILCGMDRRGPAVLLATPPLRFLGRISYSLYLWHWPILVLAAAAAGGEIPVAGRAALCLLAVLVAWASWRCIEEPFRTGLPSLAQHPLRTILAGGVAVALVVSSAGGLSAAEGWRPDGPTTASTTPRPAEPTAASGISDLVTALGSLPPDLWPVPEEDAVHGDDPDRDPEPGAAGDGVAAPASPAASPSPEPTPIPSPVIYVRLPSDVHPSLAMARTDEERLRGDGCLAFEGDTVPRECVYGDPEGVFTVALVGDSHAAQWFPALDAVAEAAGWRVVPLVKVACPFLDIPVVNLSLKREYRECAQFNEAVIERLAAIQPDLTLVSMSRYAIHPVRTGDANVAAQAASFARMLDRIVGRVAVIMDTPDGGQDIPACLAAHVGDVRTCAVPHSVAFALNLGAIEQQAVETTGDDLIDMTALVCRADPCPVVVDDMIVFRDLRHLTATFAASLAGPLNTSLSRILLRP